MKFQLIRKLGERVERVVQDLFFCSSEQIRLARKFVSFFMYETDAATFNTNELRMPLSILVGVLNTGKTFLFVLCFITSETTASFEFMEDQLDDLFFITALGQKLFAGAFLKD